MRVDFLNHQLMIGVELRSLGVTAVESFFGNQRNPVDEPLVTINGFVEHADQFISLHFQVSFRQAGADSVLRDCLSNGCSVSCTPSFIAAPKDEVLHCVDLLLFLMKSSDVVEKRLVAFLTSAAVRFGSSLRMPSFSS